MKPSEHAVDQTELIISDEGYIPSWEEQWGEEEPPEFPPEAPWLITRGIGDSDSLDYAYSLNHYDNF